MSDTTLDFQPILRELTDAARGVRETLRAALRAVLPAEADFTSRQIAEVVGLDKTLGWRCLRVATIADVAGILGSLPGDKGWRKILDGLAAAGCPTSLLTPLTTAVEDLATRIADRGLTRDTLQVIAAGELDDAGQHEALQRIRQQHFESTRLIFGVSARAVIGAMIVAPSEDGATADLAGVTLIDGLDRHRDGPPWNIHVGLVAQDADTISDAATAPSPFLSDWSRPDTLGEEVVGGLAQGRWRFDFVGRRSDRPDGVRVALLETVRRIGPLSASKTDEEVMHAMPHGLPSKLVVFDVLLHRSIHPSATPYAALYATIDRVTSGASRKSWPETTRLPLDARTEEIEQPDLPRMAADLSATYRELLAHAATELGHDLADFRIHRTTITHPPLPSTTVVRWGLPVTE